MLIINILEMYFITLIVSVVDMDMTIWLIINMVEMYMIMLIVKVVDMDMIIRLIINMVEMDMVKLVVAMVDMDMIIKLIINIVEMEIIIKMMISMLNVGVIEQKIKDMGSIDASIAMKGIIFMVMVPT